MTFIRIVLFIAAVVTVAITSDDILSEKLVKDYQARLAEPAAVDALIRQIYAPAYESLASLRQDYPTFTPQLELASERGSAYLHYLGSDKPLAIFTVQLPDVLVTVDVQGQPLQVQRCGLEPNDCPVVRPLSTEFGIVAELYFQQGADGPKQPAVDFATSWVNAGQVETHYNCFWAYTSDITAEQLTIQSTLDRYQPYETRELYGFYAVTFNFVLEAGKAPQPSHRYATFQRITREQFFAQQGCNHLQGGF